jgi:LysM repeat protein
VKNRHIKSFLLGFSTVAAASGSYALISPDAFEEVRASREHEFISAKVQEIAQRAPVPVAPTEPQPVTHTVKAGESLATIFSDLNLSATDLHKITHSNDHGKQFADVLPGQQLTATISRDGELKQLSFVKSPFETVIATRHGEHFDVSLQSKDVDTQVAHAVGVIHDSLFKSRYDRKTGAENGRYFRLGCGFRAEFARRRPLRRGV